MDDATLDAFAAWERENWERRAAAYAADVGVLTTGAVGALLDAAGVGAGTRVLDVATGPGFVAEAALARGAEVEAVDQSAAMAAIARQRVPGLTVYEAPAEALGRPDAAYDAVVAGFLLNHLARPEVGVRELVRVLAPLGRLALSVWARPDENRSMGLLNEVTAELGGAPAVPAGPDPMLFADQDRFADLLSGAGLDQVRVERVRWQVEVDPAAWFDTVARAMPRAGAVLAAASPEQLERARSTYVERCLAEHGTGGGRAALPATAVIGSGRRRWPA